MGQNIYSTNKTFKKPSGVVSIEVEKNTVPLMLPSDNTPEDMKITELFKVGTEPTEVSNRYKKLESPTNGKAQYNGTEVTLSWDRIDTPEAIDTTYLQNYFNENYGQFATKYYEERITYNNQNIGKYGYEVYLQNDGSILISGSKDLNIVVLGNTKISADTVELEATNISSSGTWVHNGNFTADHIESGDGASGTFDKTQANKGIVTGGS